MKRLDDIARQKDLAIGALADRTNQCVVRYRRKASAVEPRAVANSGVRRSSGPVRRVRNPGFSRWSARPAEAATPLRAVQGGGSLQARRRQFQFQRFLFV